MAESTETGQTPALSQGSTTGVGENTHATEAQTLEGEATEQKAPGFFDGNGLLWLAVIAIWFYYLFGSKKRRMQKAQEKKERERREQLAKNDEVVTIGRMHGKVVAVTDETVSVKPDPKSDLIMVFDRQAILRVLPRPGEDEDEGPVDLKK